MITLHLTHGEVQYLSLQFTALAVWPPKEVEDRVRPGLPALATGEEDGGPAFRARLIGAERLIDRGAAPALIPMDFSVQELFMTDWLLSQLDYRTSPKLPSGELAANLYNKIKDGILLAYDDELPEYLRLPKDSANGNRSSSADEDAGLTDADIAALLAKFPDPPAAGT